MSKYDSRNTLDLWVKDYFSIIPLSIWVDDGHLVVYDESSHDLMDNIDTADDFLEEFRNSTFWASADEVNVGNHMRAEEVIQELGL